MADLVDPAKVERIVGMPRHESVHYGRAVSAEETVYILHSFECLKRNPDLRECSYAKADMDPDYWIGFMDGAMILSIINGRLVPIGAP